MPSRQYDAEVGTQEWEDSKIGKGISLVVQKISRAVLRSVIIWIKTCSPLI